MATFILPLITVWLQVRVLPGPPAFAREAREGCRAGAHRAKAGWARELRLGKPNIAIADLAGSSHEKAKVAVSLTSRIH
jgi:hypothetical protein